MRFAKLFVLVCVLGSCTAPTENPRTSADQQDIGNLATTCGCDAVTPTVWDHSAPQWFGNANNMMVIFTGTGDPNLPNVFYAWGISNGTNVAWTYIVNDIDFVDFQTKVNQSFKSFAGN